MGKQMRSRRAISALALLVSIVVLLSGTAAADSRSGTGGGAMPSPAGVSDPLPVTGAEESLGEPIPSAILSPDASQGQDADGRPQAYWVTNGNADVPPMFQVTDIRSGEVVFAQRLPEGNQSWASTFSAADGTVYFGLTKPGRLFSWTPGDAEITDLGIPLAGEGIWDLEAAPDGIIYGGTYPGGRLFSFNPESGAVTDHGQAVPDETYVRSIEVDGENVWVGTQPRARLTRFDRSEGTFEQVPLPAEYQNEKVIPDMTLTGGRLFLRVTGQDADLLVMDPATGEVVDIVEGISGRETSRLDPSGQFVLFRVPEGIVKYELATGDVTPLGWDPTAFPGSWAFIDLDEPDYPGLTISMTYYYGRVYLLNLETGASRHYSAADMGLQGAPNIIQTIGAGPDGNIYVGGYLAPPGMAQFDPDTGQTTLLPGAGQVEGMGVLGSQLLLGRYPKGNLRSFDTSQPWDNQTNPGPAVFLGDEQDRPHSIVALGDRAAVGSAPISGRLGGAVSIWDPATGEIDVHRNVVPDQSVVSLIADEGTLIGSTSINGGYGIDPVADEAVLFTFDPDTGATEVIGAPLAGASSVNALTRGPDGQVWGLADGTLFTVDPSSRVITRAEQLFPLSRSMYGAERGLAFHDGYLYAVYSGSLWRVDPTSWAVTELAGDRVSHLAQDEEGNLYYGRVASLYRWNFALDSGQSACTQTLTGEVEGTISVTSGVLCLRDAQVRAPLTVEGSGSLLAVASSVSGPLRTTGAERVALAGVYVDGPVDIVGSTGSVELTKATVVGPVRIVDNVGGVAIDGGTLHGPLTCTANEPPPTAGAAPPDVRGPATGQCQGW